MFYWEDTEKKGRTVDDLKGGLGEAVRQSADPLARAFEKIAVVYSERAVKEISVTYTKSGFTLRAPVGLRREVILIVLNAFAGLGWGFSTERTSDETVQSLTFGLPMEQTQVRRSARWNELTDGQLRTFFGLPDGEAIAAGRYANVPIEGVGRHSLYPAIRNIEAREPLTETTSHPSRDPEAELADYLKLLDQRAQDILEAQHRETERQAALSLYGRHMPKPKAPVIHRTEPATLAEAEQAVADFNENFPHFQDLKNGIRRDPSADKHPEYRWFAVNGVKGRLMTESQLRSWHGLDGDPVPDGEYWVPAEGPRGMFPRVTVVKSEYVWKTRRTEKSEETIREFIERYPEYVDRSEK